MLDKPFWKGAVPAGSEQFHTEMFCFHGKGGKTRGCCSPRMGWDCLRDRGTAGRLIPVLIPGLNPGADPGDQHIWGAVAQPCWDLPAGGN